MIEDVTSNLLIRSIDDNKELISKGRIGIEKENLRVFRGRISSSPHNKKLGHPLYNRYITTDFSESLLEMVTPPFEKNTDLLHFLECMHEFIYKNIDDELLWPFSMPPRIESESEIKIAQYGKSNQALFKMIYRKGLSKRYGSLMQVISGIHFNYSLPDKLIKDLPTKKKKLDEAEKRSIVYLRMIRNLNRLNWLLLYLFGASPIINKNLLGPHRDKFKQLDGHYYYLPFATSFRMSNLGYKSEKQKKINVSFNSLKDYITDLKHATEQESTDFKKISDYSNQSYAQLNNSVLQIEDEYYAVARPKSIIETNNRQLAKLMLSGVDYVELRSIDLNPFSKTGIDLDSIIFLEAFMVYCALNPSDYLSSKEITELKSNDHNVSYFGRKKDLKLLKNGKKISLKDWGIEILDDMATMKNSFPGLDQVLMKFKKRVLNQGLTLSSQVLDGHISYQDEFYGNKVEKFREHFLKTPSSDNMYLKLFEKEALQSTEKNLCHEEQISFEDYVSRFMNLHIDPDTDKPGIK